MSYIYSNKIQYEDTFNLDAFGRLRTSGITSLIDVKSIHSKLPLTVDEKGGGTYSSTLSNSSVVMTVSGTGSYVVRQTYKSAPYQAGKSQIFEASFANFGTQSNVIKRVGYFSATFSSPYNSYFDGFFLESNGITNAITFQIWRDGTNVLTATSSNWLSTDYDVSILDWNKTQLMITDFQWLGVGRLRFYMVIDGVPKLFYTNTGTNMLDQVYMLRPNQPVRYEMRSIDSGSGTFSQICSGVSIEGAISDLQRLLGVWNTSTISLPSSGSVYPVLGVRLSESTSYLGVSGIIKLVDILQTSNDDYICTVQINPVISSTSSWVSVTNTPIEYSQGNGTLTVGTQGIVVASFLGRAGSLAQNKIEIDKSALSFGYGIDGNSVEWWICLEPLSTSATFRTSITLEYFL